MLIERTLLPFAATAAAVCVVPEYAASLNQPSHIPGVMPLLIAAVAGGFSTWGGSLMASAAASKPSRVLKMALWVLFALALGTGIALGAAHAPEGWRRLLLGAAALLPPAGPAAVLARMREE